jgi:GxxExxY protein
MKSKEEIDKLTHKIIGCAMAVHRALGNGFQEVVYQRALAIEFRHQGVEYQREMEMELFYREESIGTRRVDFFVEGEVMVELKAVEVLNGIHKAQAINYCEAYNMPDGLLLNFGSTSLEYHRVFNKKMKRS